MGLLVGLPLTAVADEPAAPPSSPAPSSTAPTVHGVYDFCYMRPPKKTSHYEKWRVVVFELGGKEIATGPEKEVDEKGIAVGEHQVFRNGALFNDVRDTFSATFPMPRFYAVEAETESPAALRGKKQLSSKEMIDAAGLDTFAAYSIACSDWVILPRLTEKTASWRKVTAKRKNGTTYQRWMLDVSWKMEADVYRHEANGGFTLFQTVTDGNDAGTDAAYELATKAPQQNNMGAQQMLVSKHPKPGCDPPMIAEGAAIVKGIHACVDALGALADRARETLKADESETAGGAPTPPPAAPGADGGAPATPAETVAPTPLSPRERGLLKSLADKDRDVIPALLGLLGDSKSQRLLDLADEIKSAKSACEKPVDSVEAASEKLRQLSQQGPASLGVPAVLGLAECAGIDLSPDLSSASAPGTQQHFSKHCKDVDDDVAHGRDAMRNVARCRGRVKTEWATLNLQNKVKQLDPFRLFSILLARPGKDPPQGISVGRSEGARRGDVFVAMLERNGELVSAGFGRISDDGPGGVEGETNPSGFKFRRGEADNGTQMKEHPQIGVVLGARPQVSMYALKGNLDTTIAFGGAVEGGYNASKFVPVGDEVWGRANIGFLVGSKKEQFFNIEIGPEVVKYLAGGFAAYGGLGASIALASKSVDTPGGSQSFSGASYGALLNVGIDYAITPDWNARLGAGYRQGFNNADLTSDAAPGKIDGGTLSYAHAGLGVNYTF
ncbi:MAG: porin family protein [Labilithrix sp.]|nr:porin family protein [Labilithrix sp.]